MSDFLKDQKKDVEIRSFKPPAFKSDFVSDYQEVKKRFGSLASTDPNSNGHFSLHPESKRNLGVEAEERSHLEDQVAKEVEIRMAELRKQAHEEGFSQGLKEGQVSAEEEFSAKLRPQFERFLQLLAEFEQLKGEMFLANEQFLIQLIFRISKTILLNDLKTDRDFVKRITAQIVEKIGTKENIRLKVSHEDYANLDGLRDFLKLQFPDLKNIQIDASDDLGLGGVKVETDLSRINASVESQLKAIESALLSGET